MMTGSDRSTRRAGRSATRESAMVTATPLIFFARSSPFLHVR
jgi:hypothetical protein